MSDERSSTAPANRTQDHPSAAVCIPTFKRPVFLDQLLQSLTKLNQDHLTVHVIVVDNDGEGSAAPVVERYRERLPRLVYEIEPERGIAAARNRLVTIARRLGVEYIAFIDDDEWVEPDWLANMVRTAREYQADAVIGAVVPEYDPEIPPWIRAGRFFERPRQRTGERAKSYTTANALLRLQSLDGLEGPFHRAFDLTGGSDSHLFERLIQRGARLVWCDEAVVYDHIPRSRGNARWILKRAYRHGITYSRCARMLDPLPRRLVRTGRMLYMFGYGLARLALSLPRGKVATLQSLRECAIGLGGLAGAVGLTYQEYRQTHGR
ncbi:MAG TPA: glycosyltransferase [Thermomicrobiales bacterium]